MLRIHFTADDLARVRLAPAADPLWETLLSLHLLSGRGGAPIFGPWRRQTRTKLDPTTRMLTHLAPPRGYSADFLTPTRGGGDLESGLDTMLATPRTQLRADLTRLARQRPQPTWLGALASGDTGTLYRLAGAVRGYFGAALAPHWATVDSQVRADRCWRARLMADKGIEAVLATLHPTVRWTPPVLEVGYPTDRTLHLDGRGLVLVPSFFCWLRTVSVRSPDLPPVLVYPIEHSQGWEAGPVPPADNPGLAALVGQTRAAVLRELAVHEHGCSTSELARYVSVSAPSASEHAATLRRAGLATARQHGRHILHSLTPLGRALLADKRAVPDPDRR
ncbi:MAG: winged helix-turn-helix domain-containing protein [Actinocatenispora sp.]